jgi:protein-S-isoprenylcysteine O-methyltransferase Ste14
MKRTGTLSQMDADLPWISELLRSKVLNVAIGILLGAVWGYFAYRHLVAFQAYGIWAHLLYGCVETVIAAFLICRSVPQTVSTNPFDWLIAFAGSFAPSFFTPGTWGILPGASYIIFVGLTLQLLALLSLNRSLAIVPAKRQIKTAGMYAFVRHPMYASHVLAMTGYVLASTSTANVVVYAVAMGALLLRIVREEKHLALDPLYRRYMARVRYRLVPFVF